MPGLHYWVIKAESLEVETRSLFIFKIYWSYSNMQLEWQQNKQVGRKIRWSHVYWMDTIVGTATLTLHEVSTCLHLRGDWGTKGKWLALGYTGSRLVLRQGFTPKSFTPRTVLILITFYCFSTQESNLRGLRVLNGVWKTQQIFLPVK